MSKHEVYVGLDFGTSYTKVCYNVKDDMYIYKRNDTPFIPTKIYYSKNKKEVYMHNIKQDLILVKYFKYSMVFEPIGNKRLVNNMPEGYKYEELNIVFSIYFLACIIQEVKLEILEKHYKNTNKIDIDWEINMSAPINDYIGEIFDLYVNVLEAANILSDQVVIEGVSIEDIWNIYNGIKNGHVIKNELLSIHPELFVQAVYFTNNNPYGLNFGSYMIMDIGGGTIDIGIMWRRKWNNDVIYDLVVVNILNYGVEVIDYKLSKQGLNRDEVIKCLANTLKNDNTNYYSSIFTTNINKMLEEEFKQPLNGIDNITKKRIYYSGGGSIFPWFKQHVNSIKKHTIVEDEIQINKQPLNYNNDKKDLHRLIIAMELAQPVDMIERNLGSTIIINGNKMIPGKINPIFEVQRSEIKKLHIDQDKDCNHEKLYQLQKDLYGH